MKRLLICLLLSASLLIAGCSGDDDNPVNSNVATGVIVPMEVGSVWDGTREVITQVGTTSSDFMYFVVSDSVVNSETWYKMMIKNDGTIAFYAWTTNRNDGLWMIATESGLGTDAPQLLFKYPATIGDTYSFTVSSMTVNIEVVSTSRSVTTSCGDHSCYQYRMTVPGESTDNYLSPNKGFVRTISSGTGYSVEWQVDSLALK